MSSPVEENLNNLFHYLVSTSWHMGVNIAGQVRFGIGIDEIDFLEFDSYYDYRNDAWVRQISFGWLDKM